MLAATRRSNVIGLGQQMETRTKKTNQKTKSCFLSYRLSIHMQIVVYRDNQILSLCGSLNKYPWNLVHGISFVDIQIL